MVYVIDNSIIVPNVQLGEFTDFEQKNPVLSEAAKVAGVYKDGSRLLTASEVPTGYILDKKPKSLPASFGVTNGLTVVQKPFHDLIQAMDPDQHQFFPIDVQYKNGTRPEHAFFAMNVTKRHSCVVDELTAMDAFGPASDYAPGESFKTIHNWQKKVTVRKSSLGPLNIWRETGYFVQLMMSDALRDALKETGLRMMRAYKAKEV